MELADDPATRGALAALKVSHVENPPVEDLKAILEDLSDRPEDSLVRMEGVGYVWRTLRLEDARERGLLAARDPEVCVMLETMAERHERKVRAEVRAEILLEQLGERFGRIPQEVVERVRSAGLGDLKMWSKSLLHAHHLEAVFKPTAKS